MRICGFTNCCSAAIIYDFGQTHVNAADGFAREVTTEEIVDFLEQQEKCRQLPLLVATVNEDQTSAIRAFKKMGWKHSAWSRSGGHKKRIKLYWKLTKVSA